MDDDPGLQCAVDQIHVSCFFGFGRLGDTKHQIDEMRRIQL